MAGNKEAEFWGSGRESEGERKMGKEGHIYMNQSSKMNVNIMHHKYISIQS